MSNHEARALYNALAVFLDERGAALSTILEALELTTAEFEDRYWDNRDAVSWSPETPIGAKGYEDYVLCDRE